MSYITIHMILNVRDTKNSYSMSTHRSNQKLGVKKCHNDNLKLSCRYLVRCLKRSENKLKSKFRCLSQPFEFDLIFFSFLDLQSQIQRTWVTITYSLPYTNANHSHLFKVIIQGPQEKRQVFFFIYMSSITICALLNMIVEKTSY